jgi:hypothetical protein
MCTNYTGIIEEEVEEEWPMHLDTAFSRQGEIVMGAFFLSFGILGEQMQISIVIRNADSK